MFSESAATMGSEQSSQTAQKQPQRAPPIRRGHTIAAPTRQGTGFPATVKPFISATILSRNLPSQKTHKNQRQGRIAEKA